jgi:predicted nucleic acid-binding protein
MSHWLLDTGPLVAYLDAGDPAHAAVARRLEEFAGRLATTSAVVSEAMHLVASDTRGPRLLADLLAEAQVEIYDLSPPPHLHHAVDLMERYTNLPMDFADATLLLLAEGLGAEDLLTLDRRGFAAFRTRDGRALRLVLDLD